MITENINEFTALTENNILVLKQGGTIFEVSTRFDVLGKESLLNQFLALILESMEN